MRLRVLAQAWALSRTEFLFVVCFAAIAAVQIGLADGLATCSGNRIGPIPPCSLTQATIFALAMWAQGAALIGLTAIAIGRWILRTVGRWVRPRLSR